MKVTSSVCLRFRLGKPLLEVFTDSDMLVDVGTSRSHIRSHIVAVEAVEVRGTINHRSGVHGGYRSRQGNNLDEGLHRRARKPTGGILASL